MALAAEKGVDFAKLKQQKKQKAAFKAKSGRAGGAPVPTVVDGEEDSEDEELDGDVPEHAEEDASDSGNEEAENGGVRCVRHRANRTNCANALPSSTWMPSTTATHQNLQLRWRRR